MFFTTIDQLLEQGVQNAEVKQGFQINCFSKTFRRDSDLPKKFRDQAISRCQENIKSGLSSFIVETKLYLTVWKEDQKQQPNEEVSFQKLSKLSQNNESNSNLQYLGEVSQNTKKYRGITYKSEIPEEQLMLFKQNKTRKYRGIEY